MKPLGCMTDALGSASASFEVLQRQLGECAVMVEALQKSMDSADCSSGLPVSALMVGHVQLNYLVIIVFSLLFTFNLTFLSNKISFLIIVCQYPFLSAFNWSLRPLPT